ncbi:hypothetical protein [Bradyrhizobium sp. BWC-3-1]|uniref:hypothetical protein n=1 Tax=Bradyrhizobium sp. BWC-3-1 TaxID=3080012 RepID=UPI00293E906E|nr:hypothetical protein [Bradyrhizobium sp. BWC-3-1]WOH61920.1 hypothetical protein RX329_18235 [Bradyrhizobium sp. BWC-3-1]
MIRDYLYITKARALAVGLTHEGTLFGVPAWFADVSDERVGAATPKAPLLNAWCWLADKSFDLAAYFIPAGRVLVSPIHVKGRIQ